MFSWFYVRKKQFIPQGSAWNHSKYVHELVSLWSIKQSPMYVCHFCKASIGVAVIHLPSFESIVHYIHKSNITLIASTILSEIFCAFKYDIRNGWIKYSISKFWRFHWDALLLTAICIFVFFILFFLHFILTYFPTDGCHLLTF